MTSSDKPPVKITPSAFNLPTRAWAKGSIVVGLLILLLPLALTAYVGLYSRYLADDFCTLGSLHQMGFWGSQAYWYTSWSGRYAFTFVVNLLELAGSWVVPVLPLACLVALMAGLGIAFRAWLRPHLEGIASTVGLFLAGLVVFETVAGAPNLYQSLYWQTGAVTYVFPLILAAFYAALLLERERNSLPTLSTLLISGGLMWLAVGFSETVGSLLVAGAAGALVLLVTLLPASPSRMASTRFLLAGLVGGVLGLLLMALAPGNAVRQGLLTPSADVRVFLTETVRNAYIFSVKALRANPARLFLAILAPLGLVGTASALFPRQHAPKMSLPRTAIALVVLPLLAFGLIMACMAPTQLAMSSYPDGRILLSAQFAVAAVMVLWGTILGLLVADLGRRYRPTLTSWGALTSWFLALVLLGWTAVGAIGPLAAPLSDARDFAARWDERADAVAQARQEGTRSLPVASLTHMGGLGEISADPHNWVNQCFAQAYGLDRVIAK